MTNLTTRKLTTMAMLIALSIVLVWLIHIPVFPPPVDFLEYDPADIPILIGTFAFGPVAGLILTAIAAVIQGITVSAKSGIYGIIMHFLATGTLVVVAGTIYCRKKNTRPCGHRITGRYACHDSGNGSRQFDRYSCFYRGARGICAIDPAPVHHSLQSDQGRREQRNYIRYL